MSTVADFHIIFQMAFNMVDTPHFPSLYLALPFPSPFNLPILLFSLSIHKTMVYRLELIAQERNRTLVVQALRPTINKYDFMELECFCTAKDTIIWVK